MQISALEEYAIRCALQLASLAPGETLAASQIAEREGISVRYASKILHLFRRSNLVLAQRGVQGGFRLAKRADQIPMKDVFAAVRSREPKSFFCDQYRGLRRECVHLGACSVRPAWQVLTSYFDGLMERISLGDLALSEENTRKKVEIFARSEADRLKNIFIGV